jgi:lipopolysaccharide transport system ATP-binding protein
MAFVQTLCNRGIFLQQGSVLTDDTTAIAVRTYLRTLEKSSSQNLLERTDRGGKGDVRFTQIEVSTGGDLPSTTLATGHPARIVFHVTTTRQGMSCDFTFYDQHGQAVVYFNSAVHSSEDLNQPKIGGKIVCEIDELLLLPGRYRMNAGIICNGELQDHVEAIAVVEVEQGRLRGRPVEKAIGYGNVCMHHRWILPV